MRACAIATIVLTMAISSAALAQPQEETPAPPEQETLQQALAARGADAISDDDRIRARTRLGVGTDAARPPDRAGATLRKASVDDLEDMDVYSIQGENLGEVEEIVSGPGGQRYVVIDDGGFFTMGKDHAALPLDRFWLQGDDRLLVLGVTEGDIDALGDYRSDTDRFRDVDDDETIDMAMWQGS
jgi:hypothetical protein